MGYIAMDYIEDDNIGGCWKHPTSAQKTDIVCQTAGMLSQIQAIALPAAGPFDGSPC